MHTLGVPTVVIEFEVYDVHPAEEPVRALFEARIAYFEADIQAAARAEMERLLGVALVLHPPPPEGVTHDELLRWLHARAWDLFRGGNNVFEMEEEFIDAAREHHEGAHGRTQGREHRSHEELYERAVRRMSLAVGRQPKERVDAWRAAILRERAAQNAGRVHADVQHAFGATVGELRAALKTDAP